MASAVRPHQARRSSTSSSTTPPAAREALEGAGFTSIDEREVAVVEVEDRPGVLGEVARKLADAGVNIELVYLASGTRLVIGAADLDKVRAAV